MIKLSKTFLKGGSNFPGKIALRLDKNILSSAAKGYQVILITGTNGKTTTTSMIYNIIKSSGAKVITNGTGANMFSGIVSCFIDNYSFRKTSEIKYAVMEVDEANLKYITKHVSPTIVTVTNLFRDQLDRYGEVYTTLNKILEGIENIPEATLVLNGDESLLGALPVSNKIIYYGFNCDASHNNDIDVNSDAKFCKICKAPYKYNFVIYNHLGSFYCDNCGYRRPELKYSVEKISELNPESSSVMINGNIYVINQPGLYNIYNGLCAMSVTSELGVNTSVIHSALENQSSHFGRQELIKIGNKSLKIILVKNPAGYNQSIDTITLDKRYFDVAFLLNDNYADGRDVSWIWDVNFEKLSQLHIKNIFISGTRAYDMAIRLKVARLPADNFTVFQAVDNKFEALLQSIENSTTDYIYMLATYTAMISFRRFLYNKGYIKNLW